MDIHLSLEISRISIFFSHHLFLARFLDTKNHQKKKYYLTIFLEYIFGEIARSERIKIRGINIACFREIVARSIFVANACLSPRGRWSESTLGGEGGSLKWRNVLRRARTGLIRKCLTLVKCGALDALDAASTSNALSPRVLRANIIIP